MNPLRVEPHLAKGYLALRRIPNTKIAVGYGCSAPFVGRVLNGYVHPPERFRRYIADLLDIDEQELFNLDEVVA